VLTDQVKTQLERKIHAYEEQITELDDEEVERILKNRDEKVEEELVMNCDVTVSIDRGVPG
jgi:hypothetical protein